jgi:hypothetical protein
MISSSLIIRTFLVAWSSGAGLRPDNTAFCHIEVQSESFARQGYWLKMLWRSSRLRSSDIAGQSHDVPQIRLNASLYLHLNACPNTLHTRTGA